MGEQREVRIETISNKERFGLLDHRVEF